MIYEDYIAKSRYARYLDEYSRRENWNETITRYMDFMESHLKETHNYVLDKNLKNELYNAIVNKEVMPSMRCLMTAGEALKKDNVAGYNCSYLPIDNVKSFDEAMYILLCGTGVGFSVEKQYISKLPEIPENINDSETTIVVQDSKEGWAKALRQLVALLYSGEAPQWDTNKVRKAGIRLKTFGGRASGPEPLIDLFKFVVKIFKNAQGRKLTSLECHDIMCKIGEIVVVGGVRRSAMISLSDLSDERMRQAKSGAWWDTAGHRALANNSACYTEKPDVGSFMKEWLSLYESKSGERGIFNREASKNVIKKNGRRDFNFDFGTNPCCFTSETLVAVADGRNAVSIGQLASESNGVKKFPVYSAENVTDKKGSFIEWRTEVKNAIAKNTGIKKVYKITLSNGDTFEATDDHPLATKDGKYVQVKDSIGIALEDFTQEENIFIFGHTNNISVVSIDYAGEKEIFDLQVEDNHNFYIITKSFDEKHEKTHGLLVHNSEIILRPYQFCNLTEIVVRAEDTFEELSRKARIATILGTFQATLVHFPYLRKIWKENTKNERLLGVSMTGILDNHLLNNADNRDLPDLLEKLKSICVDVNAKFADEIGIEHSTAITCVKPSGTVSQLVDSASGLHPRHSEYYYRRVRGDNKDPLTKFMIQMGVPNEPDVMKPDNTTVFTFPIKAPEGALLRKDVDALSHLKLWLVYQRYWCEHKPSVTISVEEKDWPEVGAFVWKHFNEMSGVSFLPYDGGSYKQAPYEDCTKEQYEELLKTMPKELDWDSIVEIDDNVEGVQTLACSAGYCEI